MSLEFYFQFVVPTLFLVLGLSVFTFARFQARRSQRRASRADGAKTGPV